MTAAFPGDDDRDPDRDADGDPDRGADSAGDPVTPLGDDEISRRFDAIVSGLSADMQWDTGQTPVSSPDTPATDRPRTPGSGADRVEQEWFGSVEAERSDTAERRRLRREQRREQRADEVAEFAAEQARREAEYTGGDEEHFVPGDPPPLVPPRLRTVLAGLLVVFGLFLLLGPNFLSISPNGVLLLSVALVVSGGSLLVAGMRRSHGEQGEGWDDGSRV